MADCAVRARPVRFNIVGHAHELTFSCFTRQPLLTSEKAKASLATAIEEAMKKHRFRLWAYVFMPEHVHLLILPAEEEYSISRILKSIKQPASRRLIEHLRASHPGALRCMETGLAQPRLRFWQDGGGYDRNYWSNGAVVRQMEYIHNNPVRRGLVERPQEWRWSSARD
ncbi:MAG: transposase [Chloroflexi bacterium]|nr:transposase [Chloroflexota bacterium]